MAKLSKEVNDFLSWLPGYIAQECSRLDRPVELDDLENHELQGLGVLIGAVSAYKRHISPPPPPRTLEEMLTPQDVAFIRGHPENLQVVLTDCLQRSDHSRSGKLPSDLVHSMAAFICGK
jgi:hypothetical protein